MFLPHFVSKNGDLMGCFEKNKGYLGVVRGRHPVHEARNLRAQVCDADELLEQVLGQHVGEAGLADVVRVDVDVVDPQVQIGRTDGTNLQEQVQAQLDGAWKCSCSSHAGAR